MLRGLLSTLQALLYLALAWWMAGRWAPAAAVMVVAAGSQLATLELQRRGHLHALRWMGALSLACVALQLGLVAQVALYVRAHVAPADAREVWGIVAAVGLGAPWLLALPLYQVFSGEKPARGAGAAALVLPLLLPALYAHQQLQPSATYAPLDGPLVARWLHNYCAGRGEQWMLPTGDAPVRLGVSLVLDGEVLASQTVAGATLPEALRKVTLRTHERRAAVLLDVVRAEGELWIPVLAKGPYAWLRSGEEITQSASGDLLSSLAWHAASAPQLLPRLPLPALPRDADTKRWARVDSALATDGAKLPLVQGWAAAPPLTADSAFEAALEAGRHLARAQSSSGKYVYVMHGPSGAIGRGYNYPRHAGVTWFLARLAQRSDDDDVWQAARRGIRHLEQVSQELPDGRRFVLDPGRRDGLAWIGTTALATLAAVTLGGEDALAEAWLAQVIASVDERGQVRGESDTQTGTFAAQPPNSYAQGQVMLALAAALRNGHEDARAPLERAAAYVSEDYWPLPGGTLFTLDEHWLCLAASATSQVLDAPAGLAICESYLRKARLSQLPQPGASVQPLTGPSGAVAEAFVAHAALSLGEPSPSADAARRFGELFLKNQYRPAERPLVGHTRLYGGFRESPVDLDVRMDAVQHIGCALLGLEVLLRGQPTPGGLP